MQPRSLQQWEFALRLKKHYGSEQQLNGRSLGLEREAAERPRKGGGGGSRKEGDGGPKKGLSGELQSYLDQSCEEGSPAC